MTKWEIVKLDADMAGTDIGFGLLVLLLLPLYPIVLLHRKLFSKV